MSTFWVVSIFEQCNAVGDFGQKKENGRKISLFSLLKKEPSFSFFSVSSKDGKQPYWGGPKNKTHRLLSLSHTFLLRKEPPSTTNDRFQSEWQIRIKALLPRMASNKRESVRFFTPPIIGLLLYVRDKIYLIPLFRLFLSLSSSAPPPQPLSISRRRRAIPIAKEQTRKKSARARV